MMMTTVAQPNPEPRPHSHIPPVTPAYQKAHKSYLAVSSLLGSWQLIGITVDTKEKWGITLKSPTAIPLILFILVMYFAYKMTIEWKQCDDGRRAHPMAKLDFFVAHILGALAISIATLQYIFQRQVVDIVSRDLPLPGSTGLVVAMALMSTFALWVGVIGVRNKRPGREVILFFMLFLGMVPLFTSVVARAAVMARERNVWVVLVILSLCCGLAAGREFARMLKREGISL
jgi:putative effector of murein hydrolase LrgA (UPF0299 family)